MKRPNDKSDVPEARLVILPKNIYKLKEKDKGYLLISSGRMGNSRLRQQKNRRKESL